MLIAAALIGVVAWQTPATISEFFPLKPGTKWTYKQEVGGTAIEIVNEADEPVDFSGQQAIPVRTRMNGRITGSMFYRVDGNTLYHVGFDPATPFTEPKPLLQVPERGSVSFTWTGDDRGLPTTMKGTCTLKGKRKFQDKEVDVLELVLDGEVSTPGSVLAKYRQISIYGRGIGLLEMTQERTDVKSEGKVVMRLIKYEPPAAN